MSDTSDKNGAEIPNAVFFLREQARICAPPGMPSPEGQEQMASWFYQCADLIESLQSKVAALEAALIKFRDLPDFPMQPDISRQTIRDAAAKALLCYFADIHKND